MLEVMLEMLAEMVVEVVELLDKKMVFDEAVDNMLQTNGC